MGNICEDYKKNENSIAHTFNHEFKIIGSKTILYFVLKAIQHSIPFDDFTSKDME